MKSIETLPRHMAHEIGQKHERRLEDSNQVRPSGKSRGFQRRARRRAFESGLPIVGFQSVAGRT